MGDEFSDTSTDTSSDMGADMGSDMGSDIGTDMSSDMGSDFDSDMDSDFDADDGLDMDSDFDSDVDTDMDSDFDSDMDSDFDADDGLDIEEDEALDTDANVDEDVDADVDEDMAPESTNYEAEHTEMDEQDEDEESDVNMDIDTKGDTEAEVEQDTEEASNEEDDESKEVEQDTEETSNEEDDESKEVEQDTEETPNEDDDESKEVEQDTEETPNEEDAESKEVEQDTEETPNEDDVESKEVEQDTEETPNEEDVESKEIESDTGTDVNDDNISDTQQDTNTEVNENDSLKSNDVTEDSNLDNSDIKNANEINDKKSFKDKVKGFFGGKKKEKPEDVPIDITGENEGQEPDPHQEFINGLGGLVNDNPNLDDANYEPKPKTWDHGQRERGSDDPRWESSNKEEFNTINKNEINHAESDHYSRKDINEEINPEKGQFHESQEENEGISEGIDATNEEIREKELQEKIKESDENLKDIQGTINQFAEEENISEYLEKKDRFAEKMKRPLSDTVKNMGYQEAEETYNSISDDRYVKEIIGFNDGKKSYIIVEGKDAREIKHTTIHEDIHQKSANDVYIGNDVITRRRGTSIDGQNTQINEGITEYYTKKAMKDEYQEDNVAYTPNVARAEQLERIVGKGNLYKAYFENQPGIIQREFEQNFGSAGKEIWEKYSKFCDLAVESNDEYVRTVANQEADKILQKLEVLKIRNAQIN